MKVLMINSVCGIKSTGRICVDLAAELEKHGHIVRVAYGRERVPAQYSDSTVRIGNEFDVRLHGLYARVFDASGFGSRNATNKFITWIRSYDPDVICLHNLHGYYLNLPALFDYIRKSDKQVIWTLHDCWPFTGHCCYFDFANCEKWKSMCSKCPQKREYPASVLVDNSEANYLKKKELFTGIPNMTLVTPSAWLASLAQQSFLNQYPIEVIPNWVDTSVFKPTTGTFKKQYGIEDKRIVLGVASVWDKRKGLETFLKLDTVLDDEYQLVLVGLSNEQLRELPKSIIGIGRTNSVRDLAEIYTAADVFVNPTIEDNYPTTNIEAIACGTPVVTYDTGGSGESAGTYGVAVPKGDFAQLVEAIQRIVKHKSDLIKPEINEISKSSFDKYLNLIERKPVRETMNCL